MATIEQEIEALRAELASLNEPPPDPKLLAIKAALTWQIAMVKFERGLISTEEYETAKKAYTGEEKK